MTDLRHRFPVRRDIISVFAVIAVVIYGWTFYRLAFFIPGWLNAMSIAEILAVVCYGLAFDLFESLVILSAFLVLAFILPGKLFKEKFSAMGSIIVPSLALAMIYLQNNIHVFYEWKSDQFIYALLFTVCALILLFLLSSFTTHRFERLENWLRSLADRTTVFLYIYLPLSVISLIVVVLLNM